MAWRISTRTDSLKQQYVYSNSLFQLNINQVLKILSAVYWIFGEFFIIPQMKIGNAVDESNSHSENIYVIHL